MEVDAAIQDERAVNLISTQPVTPSVCVESRRVLTRGRALGTSAAVQRSMSMVASGRIAPLHVCQCCQHYYTARQLCRPGAGRASGR